MKTRLRQSLIALVVIVLVAGGWIVFSFLRTLAHIPEAYAAWDTGTLLVEYMKAHDDRWPKSWDDLLTVLERDASQQMNLRGESGEQNHIEYARTLRDKIAIDWGFVPGRKGQHDPVTRLDGKPFPVRWEDPNEMVRAHLKERPTTQAR